MSRYRSVHPAWVVVVIALSVWVLWDAVAASRECASGGDVVRGAIDPFVCVPDR